MIDIKEIDKLEIYDNIYKLFYDISQKENTKITDVHSIDITNTKDENLNISFTYNYDYVVYISIDDKGINIEAPEILKNYVESKIVIKYPDYLDIIN